MSYRKKHIHPKIKNLRKKKSIFKMPWFWYSLLTVIVIGAMVYVVFFMSALQVNYIVVSGNQKVATGDIENVVNNTINKKILPLGSMSLYSKSIFLVNTNAIASNISHTFADVETVTVTRQLPQTITITVKERVPVAIYCQTQTTAVNNCFFIDKHGVIFTPQTTAQANMITFFIPSDGTPLSAGQNVVDNNIVSAVKKIQQLLKNEFSVDVVSINNLYPLTIKTSEGWSVYFDINSNIDAQITKMETLLKNQISQSARKKLQYIYLQYKDRAYYK